MWPLILGWINWDVQSWEKLATVLNVLGLEIIVLTAEWWTLFRNGLITLPRSMCSIRIMFFLLDFNTIRWIAPDQQTVKTMCVHTCWSSIKFDWSAPGCDLPLSFSRNQQVYTYIFTHCFYIVGDFFVSKIMKLGIKSCCSSSKAVFPKF